MYSIFLIKFKILSFLPARGFSSVQFSSVAQSCPTLRPHESQQARPPCPSPTPGVYSNSYPSRQWCHPAISSSVIPFSSCPQSLPASGSFPVSQLFTWCGQSTGVSPSASVLLKGVSMPIIRWKQNICEHLYRKTLAFIKGLWIPDCLLCFNNIWLRLSVFFCMLLEQILEIYLSLFKSHLLVLAWQISL